MASAPLSTSPLPSLLPSQSDPFEATIAHSGCISLTMAELTDSLNDVSTLLILLILHDCRNAWPNCFTNIACSDLPDCEKSASGHTAVSKTCKRCQVGTLRSAQRKPRSSNSRYSHIPGYRIALHPHAIIAAWLPRLGSYLNIGEQYTWRLKHTIFAKHDSDLLSIVSYIPHTRSIVTCDVEAIKHLTSDRKKYVKPLGMYEPLAMFGPNVGVTEEAEWVRHKKIVASSNLLEVHQKACAHENSLIQMTIRISTSWPGKVRAGRSTSASRTGKPKWMRRVNDKSKSTMLRI